MTDKKPGRAELFEAANMLRANCNGHPGCIGCDFGSIRTPTSCTLCDFVDGWQRFTKPRWSAADIQMARALKTYGYTHIKRINSRVGADKLDRSYAVKMEDGDTVLVSDLPRGAFEGIEPNKFYDLDDIIAEGAAADGDIDAEPTQAAPTLTAQQLGLSDIEIHLLKICKQLGYDSIEKREHLGYKFTIAFGSEKYRVWRLPDAWNDDDELFPQLDVGESLKIDDIDGI